MAFQVHCDRSLKTEWDARTKGFDPKRFAAAFCDGLPGGGDVVVTQKKGGYHFNIIAREPTSVDADYEIRFTLDFLKKESTLDGFFIHSEHKKGQGLARTGLEKLYEKTKELGFEAIALTAENERGVAVWSGYGWVPKEGDWRRIQKEANKRLDAMPPESLAQVDGVTLGILRMVLNPEITTRPEAITSLLACAAEIDGSKLAHTLLAWQSCKARLDFNDDTQMKRFHRKIYGAEQPPAMPLDRGVVAHTSIATLKAPANAPGLGGHA